MTEKRRRSRFAADHLMIDILMSSMFFFTIASVIVLLTCYSTIVTVYYPYLMTGLIMSVIFTFVRRFSIKFAPMLLAHVALTALYIYLVSFLKPEEGYEWYTVGYLSVLVISLLIYSMYQRLHKQTFSVKYDGFIFSMAIQFFVIIFVFYHKLDDAVFLATLNTILATSCFFVARQIGTLEDKYYHSIRAVATPTKTIMKQNRFITGIILVGIAFSVFLLYFFPINEALAILRQFIAFLIRLFLKEWKPAEEEEELDHDWFNTDSGGGVVNPFLQIIEMIFGILLALVLLYALIFTVISIVRSFRNLEVKNRENSSDAVTDVIENIKEETKPRHMDFGSGYEKRIRKKYYHTVKHAMAKGLPIKNSSTAGQIEKIIRRSGDKSITELTELYEDVRYNR